jgi:hypothetical protein
MTVLIGLNGFPRSGKDTAANVIQKWGEARTLVVTQRAFADAMVISLMRSFGLATNLNDARVLYDCFKELGGVYIEIPDQSIATEISGRQFAKWFATEGHRDVFGDDFWVDQILPLEYDWTLNWVNADDDSCDIAVVTDVRFVNEAERVKQLGGVIWNIDRGLQGDDHVSEQPLPQRLIDLVIYNHSTLEAFETAVNSHMTAEYHMKFVEKPDLLS